MNINELEKIINEAFDKKESDFVAKEKRSNTSLKISKEEEE